MTQKSIEVKVREQILKKLYVKVKDELIFIDKEVFVELLLNDIILLAINEGDIEKAVIFRNAQEGEIPKPYEVIRNELQEIVDHYSCELDAYSAYLGYLEEDMEPEEIIDTVNQMLNIDSDFLENKLHELIMESLVLRFSEIGIPEDKKIMIANMASKQVRLIAINSNIEEAVEDAINELENYPSVKEKESLYTAFTNTAKTCADEINSYKMAMNLHAQNAEMAMVFATVKQLLNL